MTVQSDKWTKEFASQQCVPCRQGDLALDKQLIAKLLVGLPDWQLNVSEKGVSKRFSFAGFKQTMSFINSLADIAEECDHHPDVMFGYNYCVVAYTTHAIDGLSQNDFICAAKIDLLEF